MAPKHGGAAVGVILADVGKANELSRVAFVERYYRTRLDPLTAIASAFQMHNQTMNIWTHLFGALYFLYMVTWEWEFPENLLDKVVVGFLVFCAVACFLLSTTYHTMLSVSDAMAKATLVLDVLGIVGLILASFVAGLRVGFYCSMMTASLYLAATVVMLGTAAAMMLVPSLRENPSLGPVRTVVLAGTVAWGLIPATHWVLAAPGIMVVHCLWGLIYMFILYGGGFLLYSLQIPERLAPGKFDLLFASHQWWHVATFLAALVWTSNIVQAYTDFLSGQTKCENGSLVPSVSL